MVVNDQSRYTLNRHVSEGLFHSRRHVDDVTLTSVILAAPAFGPPATLPVCSERCAQSTSTLALSSYRSATSRHDTPASIASITRARKSLEYGRPAGALDEDGFGLTIVKACQDRSNDGNFSKVTSSRLLQAGAMAEETNKSKRYLRWAAANEQRAASVYNEELKAPRLGRAARRSRAMAGQTQGPPELNGRKGVMTYLLQKIFSAKVLPERSKAGTACCSS
jgi:hypothetical protein